MKERVKAALAEARAARADAVSEKEAALESAKQLDAAVYNSMLLARQVERAKDKASKLQAKLKELAPVAAGRTTEEWASMRRDAQRKASQRDREALSSFLWPHPWRAADVAHVLSESGLLKGVIDSQEGMCLVFAIVKKLHTRLEQEDFGLRFGLFLHFEMKLTLAQLQNAVEARARSTHAPRTATRRSRGSRIRTTRTKC